MQLKGAHCAARARAERDGCDVRPLKDGLLSALAHARLGRAEAALKVVQRIREVWEHDESNILLDMSAVVRKRSYACSRAELQDWTEDGSGCVAR